MNILEMERKDFDFIPYRTSWDSDTDMQFDSLVIIPSNEMHDSGYRCIEVVACQRGKPIMKVTGCSDVINIDGIGGYGEWNPITGIPNSVPPKGWSIECLPCGYFNIFCRGEIKVGNALSNFEIFGNIKPRGNR